MAALTRNTCLSAINRAKLQRILTGKSTSLYLSTLEKCCAHEVRFYSAPQKKKKYFFSQVIENIKEDLNRNQEMKENLKKFREEAEKLEQSEALQKAREKYKLIEKETSRSSEQIKEQLESIRGKIKEGLEEAQKSEIGKKSRELTEELTKSAKIAAEAIAKQSEQLGKSTPLRAVAEGVKTVKEQIEDAELPGARIYQTPAKLLKRSERSQIKVEQRIIEPNSEATGIELHKDSKWFQSWQNFRENNQYVNKIFDWKMKYDESDNAVVRASRLLTDKVTYLFGGLFQKSEISECMTEIVKMDPSFDKESFIKECETEIIPTILEAMSRGDLEILKDWCYEGPYSILSKPITDALNQGYHIESKILDISHVDVPMAQIMEQGPVLILSFQAQQIIAIKDANGNVIDGDPDKVLKMQHVWALCRDQTELDPHAAWKLLDIQFSYSEQAF
ncbi:mitochondrial import inner membrane translocase subunit TIM44-like [Uloborus diversus]|uniref:mitochondrial import inner membrane translocase subunit TIM44-like n=1 Tax=Uloborus diversus TaxID=327109 RepID=UPI0024097740|nr:mitochondrial import inner membrane translocase subunit TIM44-like [Uloborus diversus]